MDVNGTAATEPRRFGKSTILNMVEEFLEPKLPENDPAYSEMNLGLFEDGKFLSGMTFLAITGNIRPYMYLDFQLIDGDNYPKILLIFGGYHKKRISWPYVITMS